MNPLYLLVLSIGLVAAHPKNAPGCPYWQNGRPAAGCDGTCAVVNGQSVCRTGGNIDFPCGTGTTCVGKEGQSCIAYGDASTSCIPA